MLKVFKQENMSCGWLYFYVHFATEVICFFTLTRLTPAGAGSAALWFLPLMYDALAFVPQAVIGAVSDRWHRFPVGIIGSVMLLAAVLMLSAGTDKYVLLTVLCLGNCCLHVSGAEVTLRASGGKLSHSAIFVAGGSFGVIGGKLLAGTGIDPLIAAALALTMIPFILLAEYSRPKGSEPCRGFNYASERLPAWLIITAAVLIVAVRGYMGYGIPTAWNKTVGQTVLLYCIMGLGKALGGIVSDCIGAKKTALMSTAAALPFLLAGDRHMVISLIGVMFFSMTMSITLALLVSVLKNSPGAAFGLTTIGLFFGTAPIFFFRFSSVKANCIVITALSLLCFAGFALIMRKDGAGDE